LYLVNHQEQIVGIDEVVNVGPSEYTVSSDILAMLPSSKINSRTDAWELHALTPDNQIIWLSIANSEDLFFSLGQWKGKDLRPEIPDVGKVVPGAAGSDKLGNEVKYVFSDDTL
jgi:hypothetical protein